MGTGLADIVSFFNGMSSSTDVGGALSNSAIVFKIAMFLIITIGALAMGIFIARIAVDILVLTLRGTAVASKLSKLGTGKADSSGSVGDYIKGNLVEIIIVIILIFFLMSGALFRLIALAINGFGALGNKLFGLDVAGALSAMDIESYKSSVVSIPKSQQKQRYDEQVGIMKAELRNLYDMSEKGQTSSGSVKHLEKFERAKRTYSHAFGQASVLSESLSGTAQDFKLPSTYFEQHTDGTGLQPICVNSFIDTSVTEKYSDSASCTGGSAPTP